MSTDLQSLIARVNALLDRPQGFLIYGGGEGGEFFANRIAQYSRRHGTTISSAMTSPADQQVNRTQVRYPGVYGHVTLANETYSLPSRAVLFQNLYQKGYLTEDMVAKSEQYFDSLELPLFRIHRVNLNLFAKPHSWVFNTPPLYKKYSHALIDVKLRARKIDTIYWREWFLGTWSASYEAFFPWEEVNEYVQSLPGEFVENLRLRVLLMGRGPKPDSIASVFTRDIVDLHREYGDWINPSYLSYQNDLVRVLKTHPEPRALLDYRRVIEEPRYLADQFDIVNWAEFYEGVAQWHTANLDLLLAHGFTEFEPLRLS